MRDSGFILKTKWQFMSALAVAKKDARIYYLKPPVLIFGIFFPVCLFCAFVFGRNISPPTLLPGLLGMTLFFIASSATPVIAPWETMNRTLERLVSTPATVSAIISGDILAGFLYGIAISSILLIVGVFFLGAGIASFATLSLDIILSAVCFSALGSLLSTLPTSLPSNIMLLANIVRLPLIFVSGVFMPLEGMPAWGRVIAMFSPLTYTCDLARYAILGKGSFTAPIAIALLSAFTIGFSLLSVKIHKKTMPRRLA